MKEYVLWGFPPNSNDETLLLSGIETHSQAIYYARYLESEKGCTNVRIQTIDFSKPIDFAKEFAKTITI
jgi:hypothetical protein